MSSIIPTINNSGKLFGHTDASGLFLNHTGVLQSNFIGGTNFPSIDFNPALLNGGFEIPGATPPAFANWLENFAGGAGTISSEAVVVQEGAASARLATDAAGIYPSIRQPVTIAGKKHLSTFWARAGVAPAHVYAQIGSGAVLILIPLVWTQFIFYFTPAGTSLILTGGNVANDIVYYDAVKLLIIP